VETSSSILRSKTCREFVEIGGNLCRRLGLPRSLGQIYGLLYLAPRPLSLDEIAEGLSISKASVSTGTRQLAVWGAVRQVWVPGERRDYFEAVPEIGRILRDLYENLFKPRLTASKVQISGMLEELDATGDDKPLSPVEREHVENRLRALARLQDRLQSVSTWLEKLL
jgi:DNA-binding transcriptional regulator GbsR (MarR family)